MAPAPSPRSHSEAPEPVRRRPLLHAVPVLLLFWAAALLLQWRGHAFDTEFGSHHDEPAHYVTGLMVRDYVADLAPDAPMAYAENYYLHYPKVAFGHWPPVFYLAQASWTLPFGASRISLMVFLGLISALLATGLYRVLEPELGTPGSLAAGAVLLSLPIVQEYGRVLMSDLLHAALFFAAQAAIGRYFALPGWKSSVLFGLFAALAILNKATGGALALVPALCLLLTLRFGVLKRFSFWLSALIVGALTLPWYAFAPNAMHQSAVPLQFAVAPSEFAPHFQTDWIAAMGVILIPFAVIGLVVRVVVPLATRRPVGGAWAAAAALFVAVHTFRSLTPLMGDVRHALPVIPATVMFAAAGVAWILARLPGRSPGFGWKAPAVAAALVALTLGNVRGMPTKEPTGFSRVAESLVEDESLRGSVFLISSDALGEGMFIAEVAMREKRPGHVVLRASKVLSVSGWMGEGYTSFFDTPEQLMEYLDEIPVGVLVLEDAAAPDQAHHRLLMQIVKQYADRWERVGAFEGRRNYAHGPGIELYRLKGHEERSVGPIRIEMARRLGKTVERE